MVRFTNNVVVRIDFWYKEVNAKKTWQGKEAAMPGPVPARCTFPDDFLQDAVDTVRRRTAAVQVVQRYRLVLQKNQPQHSVADVARGGDQAVAA